MKPEYPVIELPAEILNQPPNRGGRPHGAKDHGPRTPTRKAEIIAKAARWHVDNRIAKIGDTVAKFFEEYSEGMTTSDRYFRSQLAEEIEKVLR